MMCYFRPHVVKFKTLLPAGVSVLVESKRSLVEAFYFRVLPQLYASRHLKTVQCLYLDTDSLYLLIEADSYQKSGQVLRFSHVCYLLRELLNLAPLVPKTGRRSLVLEELMEYENMTEEEARFELGKNEHEFGKYKLEWSHLEGSYFSIPVAFLAIREKVRNMNGARETRPISLFLSWLVTALSA